MCGLASRRRLQIEPEVVERAGPEVLDHHVADGHEPQDQLPSFRRAEIDPEAALVAVDGDELRRHVRRTAEHAALVGEGAALHADHIGAVVAEELAGLGSGHELRELEDAQTRERALTGFGTRRDREPRLGERRLPASECAAYGFGVGAGSGRVAAEADALVVELEVTRGQHAVVGRRRSWWRTCRGRASARWRRARPATSPA